MDDKHIVTFVKICSNLRNFLLVHSIKASKM